MSRIQDILLRVRDTLADPNGDRWSDDRLLRLLDSAQKDICRTYKILKKSSVVTMVNGDPTISLPSDLISIDNLVYKNTNLPLITYRELDNISSEWRKDTGLPKAFIYDKRNRHAGKLYPIPAGATTTDGDLTYFGVLASSENIIITPYFGVFTDFEADEPKEIFGVTVEAPSNSFYLGLMYSAMPKTISSVDDKLELEDIFDVALKYYVTGYALRDDMDTQNRAFGAEELNLYTTEMTKLVKDIMYSYSNIDRQLEIKYTGAFDG